MAETQVVAALEKNKYYTHADLFYVNRHSFWEAGQDSWTLPPAQNQDAFISLNNVEPVLQGVLQRRRGYTLFSSQTPTATFVNSYSYRNELQAIRRTVWNSTANVLVTDEAGATVIPNLFTPGAGAVAPRMVSSRNFGYFFDGVLADNKKWDGTTNTGNVTKTGIDINSGVVASGPFAPTQGSDSPVFGGQIWANPGNILNTDGNFATATGASNIHPTDYLVAFNFLFSLSNTVKVVGIQVDVTCFETHGGIGGVFTPDCSVQMMKANRFVGNRLSNTAPRNTLGVISFGGPNELWGTTWTPADINNVNFGAAFQGAAANNIFPYNWSVDQIVLTVFLGGPAPVLGAPVAGNITLLSGRTYFYAYQNSATTHVSTISTASASTGPLTSQNQPLSGIPTSNDPQVDTVLILATADGNDQTTLFQVGSITNGTGTFTDTVPDSVLLTQPLFQNTDAQTGILHGIVNNNPPPVMNFPTKHKGRIYGAKGSTLFFSKNLDEVTTASGLTTSKWEEAYPATNQLDISELAETIQGILSDGETLWIGTERNIRRLIGDSPSNFQKPEIQFNETGLLNQNCWKVTFYEGQPVGTIWVTPDFRVMASDFNTYADIGGHIQDVLNSINPAAASAIHASYVSKGPADYYMLYIPTGSNTAPDTICVFNLRSKKWFIWQPTDTSTSSLFFFDASGLPRWLFAAAAGPLYEWTSGTFQDRIGNTPISYPVTMQTAWLDCGDYNIRKFLNQIIPTTADQTALTIQVDGASNELDFNTPLSVIPATVVIPASIPTDVFVPLASGPSHNRAFRFTFISPPSTIQNVLTGYAIEAGQFHRY